MTWNSMSNMFRLMHENEMLKTLAYKDPVTGIGNRYALLETDAQSPFMKLPVSIAVIDIDHFKAVNDTHGHLIGDEILKEFARHISAKLRPGDMVYRWGGEEFVLFINASEEQSLAILERLREEIARKEFCNGMAHGSAGIAITFSAGLIELKPGQTVLQALEHADRAMYYAKNNGRNQVTAINFSPDTPYVG